jgi:EAL domain-containing protein (putative c-di-GMP-specific phosphodiesterase class I)
MIERLNRIAAIGVELAIDDFGAGATTISYLAELPFTTLKLDRSLTLQLGSDRGQAVVEKVLEMAKCLGMKTTIEGIETEAQADVARSLGADTAQGYFFSKPIHQREVSGWIYNSDARAAV